MKRRSRSRRDGRCLFDQTGFRMRKAEARGDIWMAEVVNHILDYPKADIARVPVSLAKVPYLVEAEFVTNTSLDLGVLVGVEVWGMGKP